MIKVYKDNILIPDADVIGISEPATEKLEFSFQNLISASISIDLNNIDVTKYDDEVEGSLFYGDWYDSNLRCEDTETDLMIWNGRIKNIKKNDSKAILTIESNNYVKEIVDTVCEISMGSLSNATPAEVIFSIIKDVCGIPESAINVNSFDNAKAIQIANNGYIIASYTKEANIKCGSVINEIRRITSSYLFTINNILYYSQFQLYNGEFNQLIDEDEIFSGSYSSEYNIEKIFNDYSIVYYSTASLVAYATPDTTPDYIVLSKNKYGTRKFLVPSDEVKEVTPASYKILLKSLISAKYYGNLVRSSSHYAKKIVNLKIKDSVQDIFLNSMVDVNYKRLKREPMWIIERKMSSKKHAIDLKMEMVNFPYAVIDRDKTPPDAVALVLVKYGIGNTVELHWTESYDTGYKQYIVEFSTSITDFENEFSNEGYSPLPVKTPVMKDGLCTYKLSGLKEDAIYYFRVKVMDTSQNIGEASNVISLEFQLVETPFYAAEYYRCSGDLISGLTFVDGVGAAPSGFSTYDDNTYDDVNYSFAGYHISKYFVCVDGFSKMILKSNQPGTYYKVQCRRYLNGVNSGWIDLVKYISGTEYNYKIEFDTDDKPVIIQFRIIFEPVNYSNVYNIIIDQVN